MESNTDLRQTSIGFMITVVLIGAIEKALMKTGMLIASHGDQEVTNSSKTLASHNILQTFQRTQINQMERNVGHNSKNKRVAGIEWKRKLICGGTDMVMNRPLQGTIGLITAEQSPSNPSY